MLACRAMWAHMMPSVAAVSAPAHKRCCIHAACTLARGQGSQQHTACPSDTPLCTSGSAPGPSLTALHHVQDPLAIYNAVGGATASVAGNPVFGIVHSVFMARTGSAAGAMALMVVPLGCSLLCGTACVTANSR